MKSKSEISNLMLNQPTVGISIIIPCRNEVDYIESCIRSIMRQEKPAVDYEIIVADGMSNDGTREILEHLESEIANVRVIDNPERVTPSALNRAIQAARGEVIIRMDVHNVYQKDYIQKCIDILNETGADNVGGPVVALGEGYVSEAIAIAFHSPFAVGGALSHKIDYEGPVDTVCFGCWRKSTLLEIGLFDEELVRNQDDELNYRLVKAGKTV